MVRQNLATGIGKSESVDRFEETDILPIGLRRGLMDNLRIQEMVEEFLSTPNCEHLGICSYSEAGKLGSCAAGGFDCSRFYDYQKAFGGKS